MISHNPQNACPFTGAEAGALLSSPLTEVQSAGGAAFHSRGFDVI